MNRIDTVIFDIGNVLTKFDWDGFIHGILDDPQAIAEVEEAIWGHGLWDELDRGIIPEEDILSGFIGYAPHREREIRLMWENIGGCITRSDHAIPWIQSIKDVERRVLYLSNYSRRIRAANPEALDFLPLMDGGVFSCDVRLLKPDRAIYALLCETYNLTPSRCVFIDDLAANVQGARDFGLHAVQCKSYSQAREEVEALLAGDSLRSSG